MMLNILENIIYNNNIYLPYYGILNLEYQFFVAILGYDNNGSLPVD